MKALLATLAAIFMLILFSCSKKDSGPGSTGNKARMQVYLTDDPGDYQNVYIDIKDVRINYSSDTAAGWQSLSNVKAGTYDLLTLTNDKDTMLADAELNTGRIEQIRLMLGSENFVKVNGRMIKLETPSAQQSGLKLNIHQDVKPAILYKLLLDFDVAKSIHQTGNKKYMLKPVIRTVLNALGGSIKGYVRPDTLRTSVLAIQGPDTIASTYTLNGGFLIKGLGQGTYDIHYLPSDNTIRKQVKTGISVTVNNVATVDTVTLQ